MANLTLTPEVRSVLLRAKIEGPRLVVPNNPDGSRLAPRLYEAVDKALRNAGGKWDRRAQAHVFAGDAREKVGRMLETGVAVDVAGNEKKKYQAFYTPPDLAEFVVGTAQVRGKRVLEPSAGHGALADECRKFGARDIWCVELHPPSAAVLEGKGYEVFEGDFLAIAPERSFDRVVMNPPFTRHQDIAHLAAALKWLRPGGILVAVMSGDMERPKLKALLEGLDCVTTAIGGGAFRRSGTNVSTTVVRIVGPGFSREDAKTRSSEEGGSREASGRCPECGCRPPGHKILCQTGNERAQRYQAKLERNYRDGRRRTLV